MTKAEFENMYYVFCMQNEENQEKIIKDSVYSLGMPMIKKLVKGEINPYRLKEAIDNFNKETIEIRKELEQEDCDE